MRTPLLVVILPAFIMMAAFGAADGQPKPTGIGRTDPPTHPQRETPPGGEGPAKRDEAKPLTLDPWDYLRWPRATLTAEDGRVKKAVDLKEVVAKKYSGHPLRFSGRLTGFAEDTERNVYRFVLVGECVEGRGELDPVRHDTLPLLFYLAGDSRPLRDEVVRAAAERAALHLTVESGSWAYHDSLPGHGSAYTGIICEKTKIVSRRRVETQPTKPGAGVPPIPAAEDEPIETPAERSFERLVEQLPGLLAKAQFPPLAGTKGAGRCTRVNTARMVAPGEAKLDISVGLLNQDGSESVFARCALYISHIKGRWAVSRREGTRNFIHPDGNYRDELIMFILELEEWTGKGPMAPR